MKRNRKSFQTQIQPVEPPQNIEAETLQAPIGASPLEKFDIKDYDPIGFEEAAEMLFEDAQTVFAASTAYNRKSKAYLNITRHLERLIREAGSLCLTKAVFEKKGYAFPDLEPITMKELYSMVSYHLRRCHSTFQEEKERVVRLDLLDMECRWVSLLDRLRSTEEKIRAINDGKLDPDTLLERAQMFHQTSPADGKKNDGPKRIRKSPALRIRAASFDDYKRGAGYAELMRHSESLIETQRLAAIEKIKNALSAPAGQHEGSPMLLPEPRNESGTDCPTEALDPEETDDIVRQVWERYAGNAGKHLLPMDGMNSGPSKETRDKLREKRKKKRKRA